MFFFSQKTLSISNPSTVNFILSAAISKFTDTPLDRKTLDCIKREECIAAEIAQRALNFACNMPDGEERNSLFSQIKSLQAQRENALSWIGGNRQKNLTCRK